MSEEFKHEDPVAPENETDVIVLIKKMQQQLTALDKKIEILMSRPKERSFGEKRFSRTSPRPSGRSSFRGRDDRYSSDKGEYRHGNRESFGSRESFRPREDREGNYKERDPRPDSSFEKRPFRSAKPYHSAERPYRSERPRREEPRTFAPKKKSFSAKRKDRG
jgi:hypothetical protein